MKILGIILIVAGITMIFFREINLVTKKEVANVGLLEINKKEDHPVRWSPIFGIIVLVGGIACIGLSKKKRDSLNQ
jgi:hypothetical protein